MAGGTSVECRRYLWLHDEVRPETAPKAALPYLQGGGIFVLSRFHKSQLPNHAVPYAILTSNGLSPASLADGPNGRDKQGATL